ncbi:MAG TPA: 7-carboxy-7-deazaguanine synthase QueE [Nitrososphaera sp.]|nr:7-carboxy-7-deazaguanine synthase QueE [Nitrososphaera sp.]
MQRTAQGIKQVRLSEIFTSVEGEGMLVGTKTMFVRLAGCPLGCHWCDTPYALPMQSGDIYSMDEAKTLISEQLQPNTYKVNFTGGEPLAQHEGVVELAQFVKEKGIRTYLESSCYDSARFAKVLPHIDICKIEFKLSDAKAVDDKNHATLIKNELECLELAIGSGKVTYIKVVVTNSSKLKEFKDLVLEIFGMVGVEYISGFIIQPSSKIDEPTLETLFGFYDAVYPIYSEVRIVPQLHKSIGVR